MNRILKIVIYIMLLVLLTAEDCGNNYSEFEQAEIIESNLFKEMEDGFIAEEIDSEHLQALKKRSTQKFIEAIDLLNICADPGVDIHFRQQAKAMLDQAFVSKTALDEFYFLLKFDTDSISQISVNPKEEFVPLKVDSVKMNSEFTLSSDSNYEAALNFSINQQGVISREQIKVVVLKTNKQFGSNSLEVWEVFFKL